MIQVVKSGRLANQMFQLAFAYAASLQLKTRFYYEDLSLLQKYFSLNGVKSKLATSSFKKIVSRFKSLTYTEIKNIDDANKVTSELKNGLCYAGFFQSEKYFIGNDNAVRNLFSIREDVNTDFKNKYSDVLSAGYICVAIRLTDYKDWTIGDGLNVSPLLPMNYFDESIKQVQKLFPELKLVFISDDIAAVKAHYIKAYPNAYYNEKCNDMIEDFLLLKYSSVSVISNSSFYWWACWLNDNVKKQIFVPKYWLGFRKNIEYPDSIIASGWKQIEVIA